MWRLSLFSSLFCYTLFLKAQVINYVNNGSFEECVNCLTPPYISVPKYWGALDSGFAFMYCTINQPLSNLPYFGGYQIPRSGKSMIASTVYCATNTCIYINSRNYPRNRLKCPLKANTAYCLKYYINNLNYNSVAIDAHAAFFGNNLIDTINYCRLPLTYLVPQVHNTVGNIISDTLGWSLISGTFVATGTEKYLLLGNFQSDANTATILINPASLPAYATDIFYDDASVIELDLPAFAGRDTTLITGDSLFLGREPDVGINEACIWYKLPGITPIDTIAGFWIKPTSTCTYVVRQEICGLVKWDTVLVSLSGVGLIEMEAYQNDIKLFPNPASDFIQVYYSLDISEPFKSVSFYNNLGQLVLKVELSFKNKKASIPISSLENGIYILELESPSGHSLKKRLTVHK
ncbi:MAG TPA: T9SS type A sorting domain-containing protein [Bacteroidia bacterium]|nr:T9SS type A sorting domain-containing protein [Bacteroidia bacterium]